VFHTFERVVALNSRKLLQCNQCRRQTIHTLEAQCKAKWDDGEEQALVYGWDEFSLYRCGACDDICYEKASYFSEEYYHDHEGKIHHIPNEVQYPPPSPADFAFNTEFTPYELNELIEEMVYALTGNKLRLATVALRMVVEFIVTDKKCIGRNLQKKIEDLHAKGYVDNEQLELLHKIRNKGNAGAHQRIAMTRNEMVAGISMINLLLEKLYNAPARQDKIMKAARALLANEN